MIQHQSFTQFWDSIQQDGRSHDRLDVIRTSQGRFELQVRESDRLAVTATSCRYQPNLMDSSESHARHWGKRLSEAITCLLEPLRLLEFDPPSRCFLIRSDYQQCRIQNDQNVLHYYEIRGQSSIDICRYVKPNDAQRRIVPLEFTHASLERLVQQLDDAHDACRVHAACAD